MKRKSRNAAGASPMKKHRPLPWDGKDPADWPDEVLARIPAIIANRVGHLRRCGEHAMANRLQHNATFWEAVGRYASAGAGYVSFGVGYYGTALAMAHLDLDARGLTGGRHELLRATSKP